MNKITLHHVDGFFWSYKNLNDAYTQLGRYFISNKVGMQFNYNITQRHHLFYRRIIGYIPVHYDFILRNEAGKEITIKDFSFISEASYNYRKRYIVRGTGPVAGLNKSYYSKMFRKPKTIQERRFNSSNEDFEYEGKTIKIKMRSRRSAKNLPNSWDDIYRSDHKIVSWKKYRKQQWKDK